MTRRRGLSLTFRLWTGAAALAALAVAAAALAAWGPGRLQQEAAEALAAQARIEAYTSYQARMNEWLSGWRVGAVAPGDGNGGDGSDHAGGEGGGEGDPPAVTGPQPDSALVLAALARIAALSSGAAADPGPPAPLRESASGEEAALPAPVDTRPARLEALFNSLSRSLAASGPATPAGQFALNYYASHAGPLLNMVLEEEKQRRESALARMEALRAPILAAATALALAAPLILLALWLLVLRPLFRRLQAAARNAPLLASAQARPRSHERDELSLVFARQRQSAARLRRRQARLEEEISARTRALAAANERLGRIDQNRRRFFADVGHELRTPLTVILGEAELGALHPDPEVRSSFATVAARAGRLSRRVEDMLRIARSESGQLELQPGPVVLAATVEAAYSDLAPVLRRAGIGFAADLPEVVIRADGEWLRQVFAGIFENAAKYAGRGAELRVTPLASPPGFQALRIADNGAGLADRAGASRLFDRFERQNSPSAASGFGLGLALAFWVVETSGGRLRLAVTERGFGLDLELPLWEEG